MDEFYINEELNKIQRKKSTIKHIVFVLNFQMNHFHSLNLIYFVYFFERF